MLSYTASQNKILRHISNTSFSLIHFQRQVHRCSIRPVLHFPPLLMFIMLMVRMMMMRIMMMGMMRMGMVMMRMMFFAFSPRRVFASQAFESNSRLSVTLMDGAEMVGRMANQVFLIYMFNSFATFVKVRRPNRFDFMMFCRSYKHLCFFYI